MNNALLEQLPNLIHDVFGCWTHPQTQNHTWLNELNSFASGDGFSSSSVWLVRNWREKKENPLGFYGNFTFFIFLRKRFFFRKWKRRDFNNNIELEKRNSGGSDGDEARKRGIVGKEEGKKRGERLAVAGKENWKVKKKKKKI